MCWAISLGECKRAEGKQWTELGIDQVKNQGIMMEGKIFFWNCQLSNVNDKNPIYCILLYLSFNIFINIKHSDRNIMLVVAGKQSVVSYKICFKAFITQLKD